MKMLCCTILDKLSGDYNTPFFTPNQATAQREFLRLVRDPNSVIHAFPVDYELYEIGEFDNQSGVMSEFTEPHNITP